MKKQLALVALLAGCGGGGNGGAPGPAYVPDPVPTAIAYPPDRPAFVGTYYALGDSITFGSETPSPGLYAYPILIGAFYGLPVVNLAVGGVPTYRVRDAQLPQIVAPCALASVNTGTNDAGFDPDYFLVPLTTIVTTLEAICQRVVVSTIISNPNVDTRALPNSYAFFRDRLNRQIKSLPAAANLRILELNADPRLHDAANFYQPLGIHPNIAGHVAIAQDLEALFERTTP